MSEQLFFKGGRWRRPDGTFASKAEIAAFLGCSIDEVRANRRRPVKKRKPPVKGVRIGYWVYTYEFICEIDSPPYEVLHYYSVREIRDISLVVQLHDADYPDHRVKHVSFHSKKFIELA